MTNPGASAARDGWNNADRISIFRRCIFLREITNILIVHIHVNEAAQLAVFGKEMFAQRSGDGIITFTGISFLRYAETTGLHGGAVANLNPLG